jgi:RecA-family ATPase
MVYILYPHDLLLLLVVVVVVLCVCVCVGGGAVEVEVEVRVIIYKVNRRVQNDQGSHQIFCSHCAFQNGRLMKFPSSTTQFAYWLP